LISLISGAEGAPAGTWEFKEVENKKIIPQTTRAIVLKELGERRIMRIVLSKRPLKSETALRVKLE
jgi:hypothetical protein